MNKKSKSKKKPRIKSVNCPECGALVRDKKFCSECGHKLAVDEVNERKEEYIQKAQEINESKSNTEIPEGLTLMPGEKLLEKHREFYVSNMRLIKHTHSFIGSKTEDYHYRHIKGIQEKHEMPLLFPGILIGIICLFMSLISGFFFVLGVVFIIAAFLRKRIQLVVMHMDGGNIVIPDINSESGKKVVDVLRTQIYNK